MSRAPFALFGRAGAAAAIALSSVRRNPVRGLLTTLGITIGIAAVVTVTALARGAREHVGGQIASLGTNALIIHPRSTTKSGASDSTRSKLGERDVAPLVAGASAISSAAPRLDGAGQLVVDDRNVPVHLVGTRVAFFDIRAWEFERGAPWTRTQEVVSEKVLVLGAKTATDLFGSLDPVGKNVRIDRHIYRVVGVLKAKGASPFGNQDEVAIMPIGTIRSKVIQGRPDQITAIVASATSADKSGQAKRQAESILRHRHRIEPGGEDDFRVRSQAQLVEMQQNIFGALTILLLGIAAVSLVVGGIGVMNIMLVSVTERTREIGIRVAIGARQRDIMLQFLVESVVLTVAGGLLGTVLGFGTVELLAFVLEWPMKFQSDALVVAIGVSSTIGLVFGFFPARGAAKLDPVRALGRE